MMMFLQSNSGIPVRVSSQYVPLTSAFKATLNEFAGKEMYPVHTDSYGEIWTPEVKRVTAPAKARRLTCIEMHNALDIWTRQTSVSRTFVKMTEKQADRRMARNSTWRIIRTGKRVPLETVAEVDGVWEEVTATATKILGCKYVCHDSHGVHGRKPAYKQFATRRPKEKR